MSIQVLAPHISCVCDSESFAAALAEGYKEIYIKTSKGTLKHHQLRGNNRFIRMAVDKIPGYEEPKIEPAMNFLPAGKIPRTLFDQIEAFFRKVIQVRGTALEAMIFILWNQEQGYHLFVPEQRVAAASVSFDPTSLPAGSTVVVNVHSHGHMNAFFSGTDNQNDSTLVQFSGVFGNFQKPEISTVWRFNYYLTKFECNENDIFEAVAKPAIEVPQDWMDKVNVPAPISRVGGHSNQGNVGSRAWDHLKPYQFQKKTGVQAIGTHVSSESTQGTPRSQKLVAEAKTLGNTDLAFAGFDPDPDSFEISEAGFPRTRMATPNFDPPKTPETAWKWDAARGSYRNVYGTSEANDEGVIHPLESDSESDINKEANDAFHRAMSKGELGLAQLVEDPSIYEVEDDPVGKSYTSGQQELELEAQILRALDEGSTEFGPICEEQRLQYEGICDRFGADVADAWWAIDEEMANLSGHDLLLSGLMADMFSLLDDDAKKDFFTDMFQNLPEDVQIKIQTNGL